jgi:hypothetical protein
MSCMPIPPNMGLIECRDIKTVWECYILTTKGYVKFKSSFYIIEFKKYLHNLGYSFSEIEQSIRLWT